MEISGSILNILPEQSGEGKNGTWRKQDFIIETEGQFPKTVCITVWGDKIDQFALKQGERITASVNVESREFNGRWYTDVKAWKIDRVEAAAGFGGQEQPPFMDSPLPPEAPPASAEEDDLPF